jgi:hypothetical protein
MISAMFGSITARHRSILLAVSQGRARVAASGHPDLTVDGRWCDHAATADLLRAGLLRPSRPAPGGELVPARLTDDGRALLRESNATAAA